MSRLYDVTSREVGPVTELLKAVVEVNWHLSAAQNQGWAVSLEVNAESGQLCVNVGREDGWPDTDTEAEAAA